MLRGRAFDGARNEPVAAAAAGHRSRWATGTVPAANQITLIMTQHFTEHGRFIHVIPEGPLTHTMLGGEIPKPPTYVVKCDHPFAVTERENPDIGKCVRCGADVVWGGDGWVEPLQPFAPSPWSPVAPTEPGFYWHWSGKHGEDAILWLLVWMNIEGRPLRIAPSLRDPVEIGGFWSVQEGVYSRPDTSSPVPDRFAETLAAGCEKLLQECRVLHGGYFWETAAVIEGVVDTLKAAYAAKGGK